MNKYSIVYADPPWQYPVRNNPRTKFGLGASGQYPMMGTEEICALPVPSLCTESCALFLWSTWPRLPAAMLVIEEWGFTFKTIGFLWVKLNSGRAADKRFYLAQELVAKGLLSFLDWLAVFGVGFYAKSNTEPCLLATKGPTMRPICNTVSSVVFAPRGRHSAKPPQIRGKIVDLFGELPRVELFAREASDGWAALGLEINGVAMQDALRGGVDEKTL